MAWGQDGSPSPLLAQAILFIVASVMCEFFMVYTDPPLIILTEVTEVQIDCRSLQHKGNLLPLGDDRYNL